MRWLLGIVFLFSHSLSYGQSQQIIGPVRYLGLGDSYTIGQSVPEQDRWPVQLVDRLTAKGVPVDTLQIIATTGWRTDNLLSGMEAIQAGSKFNLVSILIGVNNQFQSRPLIDFVPDLIEIVDRAIVLADGDKSAVFLVSIPDYAYTPYGEGSPKPQQISTEIDWYNEKVDSVARAYGINYFNITDITRQGLDDPELVASDGLHPSGKAYGLFVDTILADADYFISSNNNANTVSPLSVQFTQTKSVQFSREVQGTVRIIDLNGRTVYEENGLIRQLDFRSVPTGVYTIQVSEGQTTASFKWVR